jgi:hypothetical protein
MRNLRAMLTSPRSWAARFAAVLALGLGLLAMHGLDLSASHPASAPAMSHSAATSHASASIEQAPAPVAVCCGPCGDHMPDHEAMAGSCTPALLAAAPIAAAPAPQPLAFDTHDPTPLTVAATQVAPVAPPTLEELSLSRT